MEKQHASENMKKFFDNLLEIKSFVKMKHLETKDETLKEIFLKLDRVIKNTEEKK